MTASRQQLIDIKSKLRNAHALLTDAALAYEKAGLFEEAQRCRHQVRDIMDEMEDINEHLASMPIIVAAARAM